MLALAFLIVASQTLPGLPARNIDQTPLLKQTTATQTFFVDVSGNDSNACTAGGTQACATLTGAFNKLPYKVNNAVTINVDAGTYTDTPTLNGVDVAANITVNGPALANSTVATGSATGAITSISNATAVPTVTDSGQTWTTNDLIGKFLVITSGAQNGQVRLIATNTGTVLTLASPFGTAPAVADTYAIRAPSAIFSSSSGSSTLTLRLRGNEGTTSTASVTMTNLDFTNSNAGGRGCLVATSNQSATFTTSRCIATSSGIGLEMRGATVSYGTSYAFGSSTGLNFNSASSGNPNSLSSLNPNNSLFYGTTTGWGSASTLGSVALIGSSSYTVQNNTAAAADFAFNTSFKRTVTASNCWPIFRCINTSNSIGIQHYSSNPAFSEIQLDNLWIDGCATGIDLSTSAYGNSTVYVRTSGQTVCNGATTCVSVGSGARVHVSSTFVPDAGSPDVTAINIDGTTFTAAQLSGASPTRLPTSANAAGSTVWSY